MRRVRDDHPSLSAFFFFLFLFGRGSYHHSLLLLRGPSRTKDCLNKLDHISGEKGQPRPLPLWACRVSEGCVCAFMSAIGPASGTCQVQFPKREGKHSQRSCHATHIPSSPRLHVQPHDAKPEQLPCQCTCSHFKPPSRLSLFLLLPPKGAPSSLCWLPRASDPWPGPPRRSHNPKLPTHTTMQSALRIEASGSTLAWG